MHCFPGLHAFSVHIMPQAFFCLQKLLPPTLPRMVTGAGPASIASAFVLQGIFVGWFFAFQSQQTPAVPAAPLAQPPAPVECIQTGYN